MANLQPPDQIRDLPRSIVTQMIMLSTGGFGVVVALAWNEFIKNCVDVYIKPYLGQGSGVWSLFIYAVAITVIAIVVTMELAKIQRKFQIQEDKEEKKKDDAAVKKSSVISRQSSVPSKKKR